MKRYEEPMMEVIEVEVEDILTISNGDGGVELPEVPLFPTIE